MTLLENNLGAHHHVHQDNFYNNVNFGKNLLTHKIRVSGRVRPKGGIPKDLGKEAKDQLPFRRKDNVKKDKGLVRMTSTIHNVEHVHAGQKEE